MKYYRIEGKEQIAHIALPHERWLEIAKCLVFREQEKGLPFEYKNCYDFIDHQRMFGMEAKIEQAKVLAVQEVSREEFILYWGHCNEYKGREDYYSGKDLPTNWYHFANDVFLNNGYINQMAWNDDLERVVNDDDLYCYFWIEQIWEYMNCGCDPEEMLDEWSRWLFGLAIAGIKENMRRSYGEEVANSVLQLTINKHYHPMTESELSTLMEMLRDKYSSP